VNLAAAVTGGGFKQRMKNFAAFRIFVQAYKNSGWLMKILGTVTLYFPIRMILGTLFESIGKLILLLWFVFVFVVTKLLAPALGVVFGVILWLPSKITGALLKGLSSSYPKILRVVLGHPVLVLLTMAACVWGTWEIGQRMQSELLPEVHQGEFTVEVALPVGTPLEHTAHVLSPVEEVILAEKENIRSLLLTLGFDSTTSQR
jgi:HAE1 family hydrophobic/amphiphilic exporter-1